MPNINGLPYPALSDPNNPPADFLALATAVDARFPVSIANGGTGATTLAGAQANLDIAILQVVQDTKVDAFSTTSTTYVDVTGLAATITPISSTNKVLVFVTVNLYNSVIGGGKTAAQVLRGTTAIGNSANAQSMVVKNSDATRAIPEQSTFVFLDSPATTAATTYKVQIKAGSGTGYVNENADAVSSITLMEVKA